ncbi:MAG: hypothetical protein ABIG66_02580 [Candidatus Kerfeldbacteria bacterium]
MSDQVKRILYAIIFTLAILGIAFLIWFVFFRRPAEEAPPAEVVPGEGAALPTVEELLNNANVAPPEEAVFIGVPGVDIVAAGGLTASNILTPDVKAMDPTIAKDGSMRYYNPDDDKFYRVDENGNITQIGTASFPEVDNVSWAPTTNEAIVEFPDGTNVYYDFDRNKQVTLPKEYEEFSFSPSSDEIAFKYMHIDPERRVLAVSNPDGSGARTIESLGENAHQVQVEWSPTGNVIATNAEFIDGTRQEVGFIGTKGENFKGTIVEGSGLQYDYSPDGEQMLYSVYSQNSDYKPGLWIVDSNGDNIGKNRTELNINTFASKCTFGGSSSVYCGVPTEQKYGYGLSPGVLDGIPDEIYKIDTNTGSRTRIAVPVNANGSSVYSVETMNISADGHTLYFTDATTGEIIKISI